MCFWILLSAVNFINILHAIFSILSRVYSNEFIISFKTKNLILSAPERARTVLNVFLAFSILALRCLTNSFRSMCEKSTRERGVYTKYLHEVSTRSIYKKWTHFFQKIFTKSGHKISIQLIHILIS